VVRSDSFRLRRYSKDEVLYRPGQTAHHTYLIVEGSIKFEISTSSGQQVFVEIAHANFLFGDLALLSGMEYQSTAIANEDSCLLLIPKDTLLAFIREKPDFAIKYTRQMATNFFFYQILASERESSNLKSRLANQLMSLAIRFGKKDGVATIIEVSNDELSEMLNASRQRVNMQLNEWQKSGLLLCNYGKITINNINDFSSQSGLVSRSITEEDIAQYQA
jgi:CRP-like cAMP-binding protein